MTIAEYCLLAVILIYLVPLTVLRAGSGKDYDNTDPRNPDFYTPGHRRRVWGAHLNGVEAFPFFAVAVILAEFRNAPQDPLDILAAVFVVIRLAYVAAYLRGLGGLRSALWGLGFLVNLAIFLMPLWAVSDY